jgi:uncharacterized RDD family membrane protein YckC
MNPWTRQLTTVAGGRLLAQLEIPDGAFGTSATELMFASADGVRRVRLVAITRIARSGGAVIVSGSDGELLRVKLNVPNDTLLAFFQTVKSITNQARLLERDRVSARAMPQNDVPPQPRSSDTASSPRQSAPSTTSSSLEAPPPRLASPPPIASAASNQTIKEKPETRPDAPLDPTASSIFWPAPNLGNDAVNNSLDHLRMMIEDGRPQEPASFNKRLMAGALDAGLFLCAQFLISRLLGLWPATPLDLLSLSPERVFNPSVYWWVIADVAAVIGFTVVLSWPYFALLEASSLQGTPGKLALRLNVTDLGGRRADFGRTTWRHLARLVPAVSGFALWFGGTVLALALDGTFGRTVGLIVLIAFTVLGLAFPVVAYLRARTDPFGQTLHDQISGCMVQSFEPALRRNPTTAPDASTGIQREP